MDKVLQFSKHFMANPVDIWKVPAERNLIQVFVKTINLFFTKIEPTLPDGTLLTLIHESNYFFLFWL